MRENTPGLWGKTTEFWGGYYVDNMLGLGALGAHPLVCVFSLSLSLSLSLSFSLSLHLFSFSFFFFLPGDVGMKFELSDLTEKQTKKSQHHQQGS